MEMIISIGMLVGYLAMEGYVQYSLTLVVVLVVLVL